MHESRPVHLLVGDVLGASLARTLDRALGGPITILDSADQSHDGAVLVATTSECSPDECAGLGLAGRQVVILAALPSEFQRRMYLDAGASGYLPMAIDTRPLIEAIRQLDGGPRQSRDGLDGHVKPPAGNGPAAG